MWIWSAKTLLYTFSFFIFQFQSETDAGVLTEVGAEVGTHVGKRVDAKSFLSQPKFYGTEPRREFEHKFAVELLPGDYINIKELGKK